MCGIAGIFTLGSQVYQNLHYLHRMAIAMNQRGPNDEGYLIAYKNQRTPEIFAGSNTPHCQDSFKFYPSQLVSNFYDKAANLFLAHRRLSIVDLSPYGHQPMCTADGRYWIIFNGEIYNFQDIAKDLKALGINFLGSSDTEVLLYAYREWGLNVLQKLNGMFAFAIWDDVKKELFCARDRIGIKPFYYTIQDNQFIFASDIKTIIASGLYEPQVDLEGLYHAMSFGVAPRPMTSFKDVKALEQGHWMLISADGKIEKQRYWQIPVGTQDISMTEHDAVALLNEQLQKAVARRLVADVPVGTFMSGGIDSTTISAMAARLHPGIKAFTLAFEAGVDELDELSQAQATAAIYPMEHIVQTVVAKDVLSHIPDMIRCYEEPFYALAPNYVISQLVANNGVTVILNGLGWDELFGGYSYYRWPFKWKLLQRIAPFLKVMQGWGTRWDRLQSIASAKSADRLHTAIFSRETDFSKKRLFKDSQVENFDSVERLYELYVNEHLHFDDEIEALSYMDMMNYIGNHHVYRVDQFTMNFSLEGRLPFLDHELVEAAYKIPTKYKVNHQSQKYVLRQVAKPLIASSCLAMQKKGFGLPVNRWMLTSLKSLVEEKLKDLTERDLFNSDEVRKRYDDFQSGKMSYSSIWHLVSVELWMETFIDKKNE